MLDIFLCPCCGSEIKIPPPEAIGARLRVDSVCNKCGVAIRGYLGDSNGKLTIFDDDLRAICKEESR